MYLTANHFNFFSRLIRRKITNPIAPATRTPPPAIRNGSILFELPLSVSFEVSATSELSEAASLCTSSPDDGSEDPSLDKGADESPFDETVEELPLDDIEEELSSDIVEEELSSDDVNWELSSDDVNEELSSDVVEEELSPDELFSSLDVSDPSYFSVRVSSALHTAHILFSKPSLLCVGVFVVTQLPKEC